MEDKIGMRCPKCRALKQLEDRCPKCGCPGESERLRADLEERIKAGLVPQAGDAVKLAVPWKWGGLEAGRVGILGGIVGERADGGSITFRYSAFRDNGVVSCSGGPATIFTPAEVLQRTDETMEVSVWRFLDDIWGAGRGRHYNVTVPVWLWYPED